MSKPFLVIQLRPEDATAESEFAAIKQFGGLSDGETVGLRAERNGISPIDLNAYSAIIVGGSPFDVSTPKQQKSPIQHKIEGDFHTLFDTITDQDFPFLGCCSGNGLLGSYCGATISGKYREAVGGVDIEITAAGQRDSLLEGFPPTIRALVGHKEACDTLPPGCELLATSSSCPVQMFRLKQNIYATQFHPEADAEGFAIRINIYRHHGYFDPATADDLIATLRKEKTPYAQMILHRFVERYRQI